ncbi:hypothetical protein RSOL_466260, partial [Rhizoctonia solani AG-3 Rhs1AP]
MQATFLASFDFSKAHESQRDELKMFLKQFLKGDPGSPFSWDRLVSTITRHPVHSISFTAIDRTTINRPATDAQSLPDGIARYVETIFGESIKKDKLQSFIERASPKRDSTDKKWLPWLTRECPETNDGYTYSIVYIYQGQNEKQFEASLITITLKVDISTKSHWLSPNRHTKISNFAAHIVGTRLQVDASFKASDYYQDDQLPSLNDLSSLTDIQNSRDTKDGKGKRVSKGHEGSQEVPPPFTPETKVESRDLEIGIVPRELQEIPGELMPPPYTPLSYESRAQ